MSPDIRASELSIEDDGGGEYRRDLAAYISRVGTLVDVGGGMGR
jgi:hypothetical protein